jgi:hypothetical protein
MTSKSASSPTSTRWRLLRVKCIERAFVDSLAQFDELYRQLAR